MGPINPLALEEHTALLERHQFLEDQLDDVRSARRELAKVIRAVDAEIVEVFRAAYADVADNFENLFATLFPGGQGRLRLTDPDHLLETGIEVEARPSGKNVRRLSLLSGGERSLTAMAFLFAVFRSRPVALLPAWTRWKRPSTTSTCTASSTWSTSSAPRPSCSSSAIRSAPWRPPTASTA